MSVPGQVCRKLVQLFHQMRDHAVAAQSMVLFVNVPHDLAIPDGIEAVADMPFVFLIKPVAQQRHHRQLQRLLVMHILPEALVILPGNQAENQRAELLHPVFHNDLENRLPVQPFHFLPLFLTLFRPQCRHAGRFPAGLRGVRLNAFILGAVLIRIENRVAGRVIHTRLPDALFILMKNFHFAPEGGNRIRRPVPLRGVRLNAPPEKCAVGIDVARLYRKAGLPQPPLLCRSDLQLFLVRDLPVRYSSPQYKPQCLSQRVLCVQRNECFQRLSLRLQLRRNDLPVRNLRSVRKNQNLPGGDAAHLQGITAQTVGLVRLPLGDQIGRAQNRAHLSVQRNDNFQCNHLLQCS